MNGALNENNITVFWNIGQIYNLREETVTDWKDLEGDVSGWLSAFSLDGISFRNPYQAIVGFPSGRFRSDGMLADGDTLLAVEIEAGQTHPDTNTGKYWLLNSRYYSYKRVVLFHIYTPDFKSYPWRKELAEFLVEKMRPEVPIDCVVLNYRTATEYEATLGEIKATIQKRIKQEFSKEFYQSMN
ncbi:hypothetical protein ACFLXL_00220 [Chloroflexota bacterium]